MRYNRFGRTGLFVSELCLGTMTFGGAEGSVWGHIGQLQLDESKQLLKGAVDAGINFIDTANIYGNAVSEELLGEAIQSLGLNRNDLVLATKLFGPVGEGPNARGNSRYHIMQQVKESLKRLGTDILISTRSTAGTPSRRSRRWSARSTTSFGKAMSATLA